MFLSRLDRNESVRNGLNRNKRVGKEILVRIGSVRADWSGTDQKGWNRNGRDWDRSEWIESDRNELTQRIEKERKGFEQIGLV